ncbi:MAG TPA: hypothetical protein VFJ16_03280 [Longimicrobium sp.]|nr:hypothetical protein [Longimicrobium sp.]
MPETASLFDTLPSTDDLQLSAATLPSFTAPSLPGVDTLGSDIASSVPADLGNAAGGNLPDLSGAPSPTAFRSALSDPLGKLTSVNAGSLAAGVNATPPPRVDKKVPEVNRVAEGITSKVLPAGAGAPVDGNVPLPAALGDFSAPLRRLAEAGAATPLRLLQVMLTVLDRLVDTATDVDKLKGYTVEALSEILIAQTGELRNALPLDALDRARAALDGGYLDRYEALLTGLDQAKAASGPELLAAVKAARDSALPPLHLFAATSTTLTRLRANDTAPLERALKNVAGFATSDEVFLKGTLDTIEARITEVLKAVEAPVLELSRMIAQIREYLTEAAKLADEAARNAAKALEDGLRTVAGYLDGARERIEAVGKQVRDFVAKVNIAPAIEAFKKGCGQVVDGVDRFFEQVEEYRKKLEDEVARATDTLEKQFDQGLKDLQDKIRALLKQITDLLDRAEVKQVLDQARQGVEKLKTAIDQASLQSVFDLVVRKTDELNGRIQAIDTSRLGTPQKTALKIGVKVIEAVEVDQVVRPELEAALKDILGPLRELITLLKERVLVVEEKIDAFNPGTLLDDTLQPYLAPVFRALDEFRPSQLLKPVKDALGTLQGLLEQLNPDRVVDRIQDAYGQLRELVDALEPTPLTAEIQRAANTAVAQVAQVRDVYLKDLLNTIRENASLNKLLEGTGIQEVADAAFWDTLRKVLGGVYLDRIKEAADKVEAKLQAEFAGYDFSAAAAAVADAAKAVDAQIRVTATTYATRVTGGLAALDAVAGRVGDLERRRAALAAGGTVERPEVATVLDQMKLQPLLDLLASLRAQAAVAQADLATALAAVKAKCQASVADIKAMDQDRIRAAVPLIFKTQLGDPVRGLVTRLQLSLKPFTDAVTAIQDFVKQVLIELPKQIDAAVKLVLDAVEADVGALVGEVITTIRTVRDQITATITAVYEQVRKNVDQLDPAYVLNSFSLADFTGSGDRPEGLVAMAKTIAAPGGNEVAALLQARLTADERELVRTQAGAFATPVLATLNAALRDEGVAQRLPAAYTQLDADQKRHEETLKTATGPDYVAARRGLIRTLSLRRQLDQAQRGRASAATRDAALIRMNRVILEVNFPAALKMGLQALFPYAMEMVGQLYPTETVERIDKAYVSLVAKLHTLPAKLLKEPLDEAFGVVKDKLHETLDIRGLFSVLDVKMNDVDKDLSKGLDRLSVAYEHLLGTLDARLSG